jgi:hypothetical protein
MKMAFIKGEFNTKNYLYAFDLWRRKLISLINIQRKAKACVFASRVLNSAHVASDRRSVYKSCQPCSQFVSHGV